MTKYASNLKWIAETLLSVEILIGKTFSSFKLSTLIPLLYLDSFI